MKHIGGNLQKLVSSLPSVQIRVSEFEDSVIHLLHVWRICSQYLKLRRENPYLIEIFRKREISFWIYDFHKLSSFFFYLKSVSKHDTLIPSVYWVLIMFFKTCQILQVSKRHCNSYPNSRRLNPFPPEIFWEFVLLSSLSKKSQCD